MQNAEIPLITLNSDFFIDVLPVILKNLGHKLESFAVESFLKDGRLKNSNCCYKGTLVKTSSFWESSENFQKVIFLEACRFEIVILLLQKYGFNIELSR